MEERNIYFLGGTDMREAAKYAISHLSSNITSAREGDEVCEMASCADCQLASDLSFLPSFPFPLKFMRKRSAEEITKENTQPAVKKFRVSSSSSEVVACSRICFV